MDLALCASLADKYKSPLQRTKILSEHWVSTQTYCVNCGNPHVTPYPTNSRVADFFCPRCGERYELKSTKRSFGNKFVDGSYPAMMERLAGGENPNFLLLTYDPVLLAVKNLLVIPKHFFTPELIERKRTLPLTARRAGWTGCNVVLSAIPIAGHIRESWQDEWSCMCDDDCPHCGARHMEPYDGDDLTEIIQTDGHSYLVLRSPDSAENEPGYRVVMEFPSEAEAEIFLRNSRI